MNERYENNYYGNNYRKISEKDLSKWIMEEVKINSELNICPEEKHIMRIKEINNLNCIKH